MLDKPQILETEAQLSAVIRLTIPRDQIQQVMEPAISEVLSTLAMQGIAPAGPVYTYHFRMDPGIFDFDVGVPVKTPVTASGRVKPGQLPAARVARTIYHGPYEGLGAAWGEFKAAIAAEGLNQAPNLWESYTTGPETTPDPAGWRTELNQPLLS